MSVPAVRVVVSFALAICFGLANKDYIFHGRALYVLFPKLSDLGCRFRFRFMVYVGGLGFVFRYWV